MKSKPDRTCRGGGSEVEAPLPPIASNRWK